MAERNTQTTFTQAVNVMNAALAEHKSDMPYKQLIEAADKTIGGKKFGVAIYDEDPAKPFDYFTVRYRDGSFEIVSHGKDDPDIPWKTSVGYLEKVAANPEEYIEHPAKLDWDWLKSRVGLA